MNRFFSGENVIFRFTGNVMDVAVLSLLWVVCCLPVVTIVPATAALYYSCVKCVRFKESGPYGNFFRSFRDNLRTGIPATLVFLVVAGILLLGFQGLNYALPDSSLGMVLMLAYLFLCLVPVGAFSACAALLSRFNYSVGSLLADSLRVSLRDVPRVLPAAILKVITLLLCIRYLFYLVWFFLPALDALLVSLFLEPVLRKYTPEEEGLENLDPEERPWYLR